MVTLLHVADGLCAVHCDFRVGKNANRFHLQINGTGCSDEMFELKGK
jgi:hypothetical protein